jgi:hypothetical protein
MLAPPQDGQSKKHWMHIEDISSCDYATSQFFLIAISQI